MAVGFGNESGSKNTLTGTNTLSGAGDLTFATALGVGSVVSTSNTIVLGRANGQDLVRIFGLEAAGWTSLCRNANNEISSCSYIKRGGDRPL